MVHNNKVLTVSYGTFSCTLEGFDDSFGTMKAIAEYFRDLASDDRYFGAEPPQPDADMLARIAQREIARQVEGHSTEAGRIVLRAADIAPAPAEVAAEATPEVTPEVTPDVTAKTTKTTPAEEAAVAAPAAEVVAEPVHEPTPEPTPAPTPEPTAEPTMEPEVVDVVTPDAQAPEAEVAAEQADVVEPTPAEVIAVAPVVDEPVATPPTPVEEPVAKPEPARDIAEFEVEDKNAAAAEDARQPEPEAGAEIEIVADPIAETVVETETVIETVSETVVETVIETDLTPVDIIAKPESKPETVPAADSIAAKLQRIRAVVSQNETLAEMEDYTEDQHADGFVASADQDDSEPQDIYEETPDTNTEILQVLNQLDTGDEDVVDPVDDEIVETDDIEDVDYEDDAAFDNMDADAQPADTQPADAQPRDMTGDPAAAEDIFADEPQVAGDDLFDAPSEVEPEIAASEDIADPQPARPAARVVKVKRADLESAIASGQLEQIGGTDDAAVAPDSSLSAEEEADLMRELAEVEAEMAKAPDSDEAEDNIFGDDIASEVADEQDGDVSPQPTPAQTPAQTPTPAQTVGDDEADLARLMAEADEKLDDPATSSNRDTYSHLRAAVAAAEAEQSAGGKIIDQTQGQDEEYRDDLANVVRPRRTSVESHRANRPVVQSRPAPLKLVAEQRVHEGAGPTHRGPVRPRRVMTVPAPEGLASDSAAADSAFAEFATRMGATELPDLLEAAAAYLSFVEGQEKFSRPQLMSKVRLIQKDSYNREDGLRSFGQLLRDGKIIKRGGGRFAASGDIGFRPDEPEAEAEAG